MKIQSIEPLSYQLLHETQYRMYTTAQQQITLYVIFEGKVNFSFSQEDVIVEENQGLFLAGGTQFTLMMYGEHIDGFKTVFSFAKGSESYRIFRDAFSFGRPFPIRSTFWGREPYFDCFFSVCPANACYWAQK